jgi:hypothetical protein
VYQPRSVKLRVRVVFGWGARRQGRLPKLRAVTGCWWCPILFPERFVRASAAAHGEVPVAIILAAIPQRVFAWSVQLFSANELPLWVGQSCFPQLPPGEGVHGFAFSVLGPAVPLHGLCE